MSSGQLVGRTAVVTGAARGIGRAIAETLSSQGASVVVADVDPSVHSTADDISTSGGHVVGYTVDVSDSRQVASLVEFSEALSGRVDILVNNAATTATEIVDETDEASWRRVIDVNLTGAFLCARSVLPTMRKQRYGKIVNIASVAAKRISYNSGAAYTASKAGVVAFTRHLAYEAAPDNINVNAVCPGPVLTAMAEKVTDTATLTARRRTSPAGRFPTTEDQAEAVLFLVSDAAGMIFGQALDVDGGALLGWHDTETYFARRRGTRPAPPEGT